VAISTPPVTQGWQRFNNAYRDAIASIRGIRCDYRSHSRDVVQEHRSTFKRRCSTNSLPIKKSKPSSWTHKFVCLCNTSDERVPTTASARETLFLAGLGERKVQVPDIDCNTEEFREILMTEFPKLRNCGGFELLRCLPSSRDLEVIPSPVCHSPRLLRSRIGTARIYIRPMQSDLDIDIQDMGGNIHQVTEACLICKQIIPLDELRAHINFCERESTVSDNEQSVSLLSYSPYHSPNYSPVASRVEHFLSSRSLPSHSFESAIEPLAKEDTIILNSSSDSEDHLTDTEQSLLDYTIQLSSSSQSQPSSQPQPSSQSQPSSIQFDTVVEIVELLSSLTSGVFSLAVRRSDVLGSALCGIDRKAFSPKKVFDIKFLGEEGYDGGGPRREFFRLLANDVKRSMCVGREDSYFLRHDVNGLLSSKFEKLGQLIVMSIAQGGNGFPFFDKSVYDYICGKSTNEIHVDMDSIPDSQVHLLLQKMKDAVDDESLQEILFGASDVVFNSGFTKPLTSIKLSDVNDVLKAITLHNTILQCLGEIEQIKIGLKSLGFLEIVQRNSDILSIYFTSENYEGLTADQIQELFEVRFSDKGTSARVQEEKTYMYFIKLLNECEDSNDPDHLTLEEILIFFSASDRIPAVAFDPGPTILFNEDNIYPTSSTCGLTLVLPTKFCEYSSFKHNVTLACKYHGGFGLQ
jgi:hypothetical protein